MIKPFRHRGLKRLYEKGDTNKLSADQVNRIEDVLAHLDVASRPSEMDFLGYRLHRLKGDLKDVCISANWRITFRFEDGDAFDISLVDYH